MIERTPRRGISEFAGPRSMWGPRVDDARWLWSERVLDLVVARVGAGADRGDVADELLSMRQQRRYLLLELLAETRRASVFAAIDQLLARDVALKVLRADDDGEQVRWRLLAEMQLMARFDHPHLVRAHDFGVHDGWPYVVMELCDDDLERWAPGKPRREVLRRLLESGRGLEAMHAAGFVHGDVKPENVLLVDGIAKLGDLGIAGEPGWSPRVQGTAGYIAPEVAEGRREFASDVFSFAVMTWALLLGQPPFGGPPPNASTSAAVIVQIERARAGLLELDVLDRRGASAVVSALRPALVSEPADRPTLPELLAQLESLIAPRGVLGRVRTRLWPGSRQ